MHESRRFALLQTILRHVSLTRDELSDYILRNEVRPERSGYDMSTNPEALESPRIATLLQRERRQCGRTVDNGSWLKLKSNKNVSFAPKLVL